MQYSSVKKTAIRGKEECQRVKVIAETYIKKYAGKNKCRPEHNPIKQISPKKKTMSQATIEDTKDTSGRTETKAAKPERYVNTTRRIREQHISW